MNLPRSQSRDFSELDDASSPVRSMLKSLPSRRRNLSGCQQPGRLWPNPSQTDFCCTSENCLTFPHSCLARVEMLYQEKYDEDNRHLRPRVDISDICLSLHKQIQEKFLEAHDTRTVQRMRLMHDPSAPQTRAILPISAFSSGHHFPPEPQDLDANRRISITTACVNPQISHGWHAGGGKQKQG